MNSHLAELRRRAEAEGVAVLVDKAIQLPTEDAKNTAEKAAREFENQHGCCWQQCMPRKGKALL